MPNQRAVWFNWGKTKYDILLSRAKESYSDKFYTPVPSRVMTKSENLVRNLFLFVRIGNRV